MILTEGQCFSTSFTYETFAETLTFCGTLFSIAYSIAIVTQKFFIYSDQTNKIYVVKHIKNMMNKH